LYDRNALIEVVREKALQFGDFTLASGKKASFYLDCRCVTLDAQGANLVAAGMIQSWLDANTWPDAVGGMAEGKELRGFFCRKEAKDHGKGKQIEGPVKSGDQVVIVEDVVTTGGSSLKAIEACEAFGLKVTGVTAIIDRMAGGREAFESRGYPLTTLLTIRDFGIEPE
jgi:orotate phosphoribosyltransferase